MLGGVASRRELLRLVPEHVLDRAVRAGRVDRVLPHVYANAREVDAALLRRAALRYVNGRGALSHTSALALWQLPVPTAQAVHVMVPAGVQHPSTPALRVHRRTAFDLSRDGRSRDGLPVTTLEAAVVDSWPLLPGAHARAPAIVAVRERRTTAARLVAAVGPHPNLKGRASLLHLLDLLAAGCESELELHGHERVFNHRSLPHALCQYRVRLGARTVYLDRAYLEEMVAVELDGSEHHRAPQDRERDMRRDSALATRGWLVLRFSSRRLREDPRGVRRELLTVLRRRRAQLRSA